MCTISLGTKPVNDQPPGHLYLCSQWIRNTASVYCKCKLKSTTHIWNAWTIKKLKKVAWLGEMNWIFLYIILRDGCVHPLPGEDMVPGCTMKECWYSVTLWEMFCGKHWVLAWQCYFDTYHLLKHLLQINFTSSWQQCSPMAVATSSKIMSTDTQKSLCIVKKSWKANYQTFNIWTFDCVE